MSLTQNQEFNMERSKEFIEAWNKIVPNSNVFLNLGFEGIRKEFEKMYPGQFKNEIDDMERSMQP